MKIWSHFFLLFIKTVLAVLCLILVLYFIITYIENSLYYFKSRPASAEVILSYYFWQIPDIGLQILPFAVLITGVIMHWTLSRSGEISALRSAGMSLWRISFPFICGALFYVFINLIVSEFARPYSFKKFYNIKNNIIEHVTEKDLFIKTTWIKSEQGILHFAEYNSETKTLKNPEFFEYNTGAEPNLKSIVRSTTGEFDEKQNTWILPNAFVTNVNHEKEYTTVEVKNFDTKVPFAPPKILKEKVSSNELSYFELSNLIDSARRAHINVSNRIVDLYLKISLPFSNLLFLLFTIPFGLQRERQETGYLSILLCLALTASYWFGNLSLKNMAVHGFLSPFIAAWGLNILFGIFSVIVVAKLDKPA